VDYVAVIAFDALPSGRARTFTVEGTQVMLVREGEKLWAVSSRCPHAGAPLDQGRPLHGLISCVVHGARFDLGSGRCVNAPYDPLSVYPVRIVEGMVEVCVTPQPTG
jgi:nitrite reductase/ring-hydroxylating ferredoxin subunit